LDAMQNASNIAFHLSTSDYTGKAERPDLTALPSMLRADDRVVIWRVDRLGRSLKDLIYLVERLDAAGVGLRSLQESIDTASIGGRLVFHLR
jgi:DNA invertase Pin-like site-specific DNA recombinase